jgi:hypothetical protein
MSESALESVILDAAAVAGPSVKAVIHEIGSAGASARAEAAQADTSYIYPIVLILGIIAIICLFFYKRAIHEFRINQVETLAEAFAQQHERVPCVITESAHPTGLWLADTVRGRAPLASYKVEDMMPLTEFLTVKTNIPEIGEADGAALAEIAGIALWSTHTILPIFKAASSLGSLYKADIYAYAGPRGLHKTTAAASLLIATDGVLTVSIMHEEAEPYLPADWQGRQLGSFTYDDTPLLGHIDYMDIVLRPGNALLLPAHWTYCITAKDTAKDTAPPLYTLLEFHHPVSAFVNRVLSVRGLK